MPEILFDGLTYLRNVRSSNDEPTIWGLAWPDPASLCCIEVAFLGTSRILVPHPENNRLIWQCPHPLSVQQRHAQVRNGYISMGLVIYNYIFETEPNFMSILFFYATVNNNRLKSNDCSVSILNQIVKNIDLIDFRAISWVDSVRFFLELFLVFVSLYVFPSSYSTYDCNCIRCIHYLLCNSWCYAQPSGCRS